MGPRGIARAILAAERQYERESQKRRRELARREKESAKLSALEQARLEVETFENQIDVLLSIHKEPSHAWDWTALAATLNYPPPHQHSHSELRARQFALVANPAARASHDSLIEDARAADAQTFNESLATHTDTTTEIRQLRELAHRVLAKESLAFIEAFAEFNPVSEFSSAGSLRRFAVESATLIECVFKASIDGIPNEVKSLTSSGKVSTKAMPKAQYHEIYKDYLCACVLRMAREVFDMLPVETFIVTAIADVPDVAAGRYAEQPVLSVAMDRPTVAALDFNTVSSSDAIALFQHRGNFKVLQARGFQPITPFVADDFRQPATDGSEVPQLLLQVQSLRKAISTSNVRLKPLVPSPATNLGSAS